MELQNRTSMPTQKTLKGFNRYELIDDDGLRLAIIFTNPDPYKDKKVRDLLSKSS